MVMRILLFSAVVGAVSSTAQVTGRIAGRVIADESGAAVAGVVVVATRQNGGTALNAITSADGAYAIGNVPLGSYWICLYGAGSRLNPCAWSAVSPVAVSSGISSADIRARRGVDLVITIADPQGLRKQYESQFTGKPFIPQPILVYITPKAGKRSAVPPVPQGAGGYQYRALVPPDTDLTLSITSTAFLMADATGAPTPSSGYSVALRLAVPAESTATPGFRHPLGWAPGNENVAKIVTIVLRGLAKP